MNPEFSTWSIKRADNKPSALNWNWSYQYEPIIWQMDIDTDIHMICTYTDDIVLGNQAWVCMCVCCLRLFTGTSVNPLHMNLQAATFKDANVHSVMSGTSETAACRPCPVAPGPSALASPASSPSSRQWLFLAGDSVTAPVCQLRYSTTVLFRVLCYKVKNAFFILLVFYVLFVQKVL